MKVVHVIRDLDASSGGPSRSIPALADAQSRIGDHDISINFQNRGNPILYPNPGSITLDEVEGRRLSFGGAPARRVAERFDREGIDVIHLHGLWSPSLHRVTAFARKKGIPYVMSPRGMLSDWCLKYKALRKSIAWRGYQKSDLNRAACVHATSDDESRDIRKAGIDCPIAVIPNGCSIPPSNPSDDGRSPLDPASRWAISYGRLHRVKGFDVLVETWKRVRPTGWKLAICGPDEDGYRGELRRLIADLNLDNEVKVLDEVDGDAKWSLLRNAELFVLASHTENFGMAIAEAMAAGIPVITTKGTPWKSVQDHQCGWWVSADYDGLATGLTEASRCSTDELVQMGQRANKLIESSYGWNQIAQRTLEVYRWIVNANVAPDDVKIATDVNHE